MNLHTKYLGLDLRTPLVASPSPLTRDLDNFKKLEDAGVAAIVLHSLFQEQAVPCRANFEFGALNGPDAYCELIAAAKASVNVPLIGSLNCVSVDGWLDSVRQIEQAGANALELNIYSLPADPGLSASKIEKSLFTMFRSARKATKLPIAVKLWPFYTNLANIVTRLELYGADGLVLFNRFYQSDLHLERGQMIPNVIPSSPIEARLALHWISMLHGRTSADLAATTGIHSAGDAIKLLMAGADVTMVCSALLQKGVGHLKTMEHEMVAWLQSHHFSSIGQVRGLMSREMCGDPGSAERSEYFHTLSGGMPAFAQS